MARGPGGAGDRLPDGAFLGDDAMPAQVEGFGPVPAPFARHWLGDSAHFQDLILAA